MPKGLSLPVGVNKTGSAAMVDGEDNNYKIISIALSDCDNDHAFQQDIGLGADMIFSVNDPISTGKILSRIDAIFEKFEAQHRFKLLKDSIRWRQNGGDLTMSFDYHDLESDEIQPFNKKFTG